MTNEQQQKIRSLELMQACARVMLVRGHNKRIPSGTEDEQTVDDCVRISFGGDWDRFEAWAIGYAENGCGIAG